MEAYGECSLLGPGDPAVGPRGAVGPADLRVAVREAPEERRGGRGSDLRGGAATDHALRGHEDRRATGPGDAVPHAGPAGASAHADDQLTINALRGQLAEYGVTAPQGPAHVDRLARAVEDPGSGLPGRVRELGVLLLAQIAEPEVKIASLESDLNACARQDEEAARLMTIPGIGPVAAR